MPTIELLEDDHTGDDNTGSRKRVAIDPSAITTATYKEGAAQRNEIQSPLRRALSFLHGTIVTLHKDYQSTVKRVGEEFSKAFDAYQRNGKTLTGMIESTDINGEPIPARIPKSAKLHFELKTSIKPISESNEFQVLQQEAKDNVELYQQQQAKILIKYKQLEVQHLKLEMHVALARSLHTLAKGHQLVNGQQHLDTHFIVNSLLERDPGTLLENIDITLADFRNCYKTVHSIHDLPEPAAAQAAAAPIQPAPLLAPQPPNLVGPYTYVELEAISIIQDLDIPTSVADRFVQPHILEGDDFQALVDAREQATQHLYTLCQQDMDSIAQFKHDVHQFPARQQEYQQQLTQYTLQLQQFQQALTHPAISDLDGLLKLATSTFAIPLQLYLKQVAANTTALDLKRLHKETFTQAATIQTDMEIDTEAPADMKHIKDLVAKLVTDQLNHQQKRIAKAAGTKVTQAVKKSLTQNAKNQQRGQPKGGASNKKKSPKRAAKDNGKTSKREDSTSRSRSPARRRSRGRKGKNSNIAQGKDNDTTGSSKNSNRGRSRSSSRGKKKRSGTRRSRSSRRSTQNSHKPTALSRTQTSPSTTMFILHSFTCRSGTTLHDLHI